MSETTLTAIDEIAELLFLPMEPTTDSEFRERRDQVWDAISQARLAVLAQDCSPMRAFVPLGTGADSGLNGRDH